MRTKDCSCGKKMVLVLDGILQTRRKPRFPQHWYCRCGEREEGPGTETKKGGVVAMHAEEAWASANGVSITQKEPDGLSLL